MVKKIIITLLLLPFFILLINVFLFFSLQKNVKTYLNLNFAKSENEELIEKSAKKIIKNYKKINKNLKKIIFKNFSEDLDIILSHFLSEKINYLVLLQNSDELRATGGFTGSYFFLEFSHGVLKLNPIQDIYTVAGQQNTFPQSPAGHHEYLSEGKGLLIQDANWWPELAVSAQKITNLWQNIANNSSYLDNKKIDGLIFVNLNFIENLLAWTGPIHLPDYEKAIDANNFAQIARSDRLNFFAGSKEKANFLNHSKVALENKLSQLSDREKLDLIRLFLANLNNKNIQIYSQNKELETIWGKQGFAGQLVRKNLDNFYFYSVESNVAINKANASIDREFYFYQDNGQVQQIIIKFINQNQKPTTINTNPELNMANHLAYVNYQRIYLAPEVKIKKVQSLNENKELKDIDFNTQPYFNQFDQEFLELSFLISVPEQSQLNILVDIDQNFVHDNFEIQKQSGIDEIPVYFYLDKKLEKSWTLTGDRLE
jgi:hypothetical protein